MPSGPGSVLQPLELHELLLRPLNAVGVRYMVTGGLAAIVYGEPRLTNDVDIVVQVAPGDAPRFREAYGTSEYYVPPVEVIEEEARRSAFGHFNVLHLASALRADIYCAGEDALAAWAFDRRRPLVIGDDTIWLAPMEYVILQKLRYHRESGADRHLRDIVAMRRISGDLIDAQALDTWMARLGLQAEWEKVLNLTPDGTR